MTLDRLAIAALLLVSASCGNTGQMPVQLPLRAAGIAPSPFLAKGWTITLTRAELGFGAVYFCATQTADPDLCQSAIAEMTTSVTIDALDPDVVELGTLEGVTGTIRSTMYDLGISWFLPAAMPQATEGAVDGHSLRLEGHATRGADAFDFVASVDVVPSLSGRTAVLGERTSAVIATGKESCTVHVDPSAWASPMDFDSLFAASAGGSSVVTIESGSPSYDALVLALSVTAPPTFEWTP